MIILHKMSLRDAISGLAFCFAMAVGQVQAAETLDEMQREIETDRIQLPPPILPKWIAFSFSMRCLADACGDGKWGIGYDADKQRAINKAENDCESNTLRPGTCGSGGVYKACRTDRRRSWSAVAVYDDYRETWADGEGIAYPDATSASQAALANCHVSLHKCRLVWTEEIECPN